MLLGFLKAVFLTLEKWPVCQAVLSSNRIIAVTLHTIFEVPAVIHVFGLLEKAGVLATAKVYIDKLLKPKSKLWKHLVLHDCQLTLARGLRSTWRSLFKSTVQNEIKCCNVYKVPSNMTPPYNTRNCNTSFFQ